MGVWEAIELLNTLIDESDPDVSSLRCPTYARETDDVNYILQTSMSQIDHLLQTAEAIRRDGKPEWMQVKSLWFKEILFETDFGQVTGLVHDLGKLLLLFGSEGQWDVVGVSTKFLHLQSSLG